MTVRVRFAPSPTGELHLGGARTALVNALFARKTGGVFVLRIEDTDLERNVPGAEDRLEADLAWLGIVPDESPRLGGPFPPYRQSERTERQMAAFEQAKAAGRVYPCFCPAGAQAEHGCPGGCGELGEAEAARRIAAGERPAWRFRLLDDDRAVDDLLHGHVDFAGAPAPDPVVLRPDGRFNFLFASVVDDSDQKITHVVRGDDHLPNAWKQAQMLKALGREVPRYAHLPLILGADRTPLSKRHGHSSVGAVRDAGYPPEAIVLALAHLGATPPEVEPGTDPWPRLVASFELERLNTSAAVHDQPRLEHLSAAWLRALPADELARRARGRADRDAFLAAPDADPEWWPELLALCCLSQTTIAAAIELAARLAGWPGGWPEGEEGPAPAVLDAWLAAWPEAGLGPDQINEIARKVTAETGAKRAALYHPLRLALTGSGDGPALAKLAPLFDRAASAGGARAAVASCRERLARARR